MRHSITTRNIEIPAERDSQLVSCSCTSTNQLEKGTALPFAGFTHTSALKLSPKPGIEGITVGFLIKTQLLTPLI